MKNFFHLSLLIAILLQGCIVSKKKYEDLLAQKVKTDGDLIERSNALDKTSAELTDAQEKLRGLKKDTTDLGQSYRATRQKLNELNTEYEQLNSFYKNLLNNSGKLNRDMAQQKDQLLAIQESMEKTRKLNDSLGASLIEREKKVQELEGVLSNKDKAVQNLKSSISNALLNFKESDLTVNVKNGKVYVSLAEQLLFGSGSIEIDAKGVTALQQLGKALKDQRDIQIMVEGHTDNVPISKKTMYMQDNWDLSVMRATSITKILIKAGVSANQISAAGKGEYSALAPNDTPQNKQKNRRTEIIVTPNLDELFKILGTD